MKGIPSIKSFVSQTSDISTSTRAKLSELKFTSGIKLRSASSQILNKASLISKSMQENSLYQDVNLSKCKSDALEFCKSIPQKIKEHREMRAQNRVDAVQRQQSSSSLSSSSRWDRECAESHGRFNGNYNEGHSEAETESRWDRECAESQGRFR